jgi:HAE1 family hydrophobic/amphiphilic exporter-1
VSDERESVERSGGGVTLGERAIRYPVTTWMLYLCLLGYGAFVLYNLPLNRLPDVELPVIAVITTYTGASPADVETLITAPIERAVASVEGVETVRSTSRQGTSMVIISFTWGRDMDDAETDVRKNIELFAADFLPDETSRPLTFAFDPSLAPVIFLGMEGTLDPHRLRTIAEEEVQPFLARLDGVAAAEVMGGLDRQIHVRLDPIWLQANGISPQQVVDALAAANVVVPAGAIDDGTQLLNIQPTASFRTVEEIEDVVVGVRGTRPVRLAEVAEVIDGFEEETHVVSIDGSSAVMVAVRKQSDANTVSVARAVREALPELNARLPDGVRLVPVFDDSDSILRAIGNLGTTAWQGFLLTALVILAFLRSWRASLINVLAIPISVVVGFVAMSMLGVTLNLVSLAGLVLAIGMVVDNATVVLEVTYQNLEAGMSPRKASIEATKEMTMPVVASTLTTVVVFAPILLVDGIAGELFRDLVLTITTSLIASLIVSISLVPMLAANVLGDDLSTPFAKFLTRTTWFLDKLGPLYDRGLRWSLAHPWTVMAMAFGAFVASLAVTPLLGQDFLPPTDNSDVRVEVTAAPGISIDEMRERIDGVEAVIRDEVPETRVIYTDYGQSEGFAAIFGSTANRGTIRLRLVPPRDRERSQREIEQALTRRFRDVPGVDLRIATFGLGGGAGGDIELKLFGDDLDELRRTGERLRDELGSLEGVVDTRFSMTSGNPELDVIFDRERMRSLGLTPAGVASTLAAYFQGLPAGVFREDGDEHMIRVRAPREYRADLDALRYLPIPLPAGGTIPLASIARIGDRLGATDIERENQRRLVTVTFVGEGSDLGALTERVEAALRGSDLPEGVTWEIGGTAEDLRDAFFKLAMALAAALALVYMVMASQFESLLEPFVIMVTVPLAIIGVVMALAITGTSIQVTALVGVILLGGVVVNNGIVLIDVLKRRRAQGKDLKEATLEAGRTRLRPILITAVTTIVGMIPPAFGTGDGAEIWAPMARAVVGGLTVSTILTLFVVPVAYVLLAGWIDRRRARRLAKREGLAVDESPSPETPSTNELAAEAAQ